MSKRRKTRNIVDFTIPGQTPPKGINIPGPYYQSLINSFPGFGDEWRERGFGANPSIRQFLSDLSARASIFLSLRALSRGQSSVHLVKFCEKK